MCDSFHKRINRNIYKILTNSGVWVDLRTELPNALHYGLKDEVTVFDNLRIVPCPNHNDFSPDNGVKMKMMKALGSAKKVGREE